MEPGPGAWQLPVPAKPTQPVLPAWEGKRAALPLGMLGFGTQHRGYGEVGSPDVVSDAALCVGMGWREGNDGGHEVGGSLPCLLVQMWAGSPRTLCQALQGNDGVG